MLAHFGLAVLCGSLVGFSLGLIGGGGSVLAVPLLLYVVGEPDPHVVIGTAALAVGLNALANLLVHARGGHVRWRPAALFAGSGVIGAALGSSLGKHVAGQHLLGLFALLMMVVAILMQRDGAVPAGASPSGSRPHPGALIGTGVATGALAGFFGIGGGFLIVPGLRFAAHLTMIEAIASSLVAVSALGLTTAVSYALAGLVSWSLAGFYLLGGMAGGLAGAHVSQRLSHHRTALSRLFGVALVAVAIYMLWRTRG